MPVRRPPYVASGFCSRGLTPVQPRRLRVPCFRVSVTRLGLAYMLSGCHFQPGCISTLPKSYNFHLERRSQGSLFFCPAAPAPPGSHVQTEHRTLQRQRQTTKTRALCVDVAQAWALCCTVSAPGPHTTARGGNATPVPSLRGAARR